MQTFIPMLRMLGDGVDSSAMAPTIDQDGDGEASADYDGTDCDDEIAASIRLKRSGDGVDQTAMAPMITIKMVMKHRPVMTDRL